MTTHALSSLVTQVTHVPETTYTPNDCASSSSPDTPYGTPGTPSSLPLVKPNSNGMTMETKKPSMLDFLIRSFAACFVNKDTNNSSTSLSTSPSPSPTSLSSSAVTVQPPVTPVKIEKSKDVVRKPSPTEYLIPQQSEEMKGRKLLVLDLDETLVHSCFQPVPNSDFIIPIVIEGVRHTVYVLKRPFVDDFLYEMSKIYEIVVFTASVGLYANPLLDLLDTRKVISHRLFREHCTFVDGSYVKDLSRLGRDLGDIIIIDNSKNCYKFQPENAMPSITWLEDKRDNQLARMIPYLVRISQEPQVYNVLKEFREADAQWSAGQQW